MMKATTISTASMGLSFSTSKKHPSSHSWHCSKALKTPCGSVWPPLLLTRRKEQILQYLWCSFPLTLHLVGPQDGCHECSHKGQVKNTNYTNLSATVERSHLKGKCKLISERSIITSACTTYSIYSKKHHKLQSHSTKKYRFSDHPSTVGSLRTARPSFPHPWWPFFRLSLRTLFAAPRKRGNKPTNP